jgi:hypothetical protein
MADKEEYSLQQQWADVNNELEKAKKEALRLMPAEPPFTVTPEYERAVFALGKARQNQQRFEEEINSMVDTIPGLRESLTADADLCSIAMSIAKETLDDNCGSIGEIITRVTREKEKKES